MESALIVPVPAAEPVVGRHRRVLDRAATLGVPAHVTVLYPFLPPDRISGQVLDDVRACLAAVSAFTCVFSTVEWFGQDVVWLAPEPAAPFRALTEAVWRQFPDHPPYRGAHADVVPHLTIGDRGERADMRRAADDVRDRLPVHAHIDTVLLIAGSDAPGSWHPVAEFAL
jgi:2'-5' RNA ligase